MFCTSYTVALLLSSSAECMHSTDKDLKSILVLLSQKPVSCIFLCVPLISRLLLQSCCYWCFSYLSGLLHIGLLPPLLLPELLLREDFCDQDALLNIFLLRLCLPLVDNGFYFNRSSFLLSLKASAHSLSGNI